MLKEFKAFLFRGNLLELATAVIIGGAFGKVIDSLVKDVLTPLIAALGGQPDFSNLRLKVGDSAILYGRFLNNIVSFVIVGAVVFAIIKSANRMMKLRASGDMPADEAPPPTDEAVLLGEIRDLLAASR